MPHLLGVERALRRAFIRAQSARSTSCVFPHPELEALPINTQ